MKNKNIQEAEDFLKNGGTDPHRAVDLRSRLAGEYSFFSGMLQDIEARYAKVWMAIRSREDVSSDKQADKEYSMTDDGINENGLKKQIKAIEKMMSALKTIIEVQMNERNNSGY